MPAARVALVPHSPWLGGAERCVLELAEALGAAGREVHALVPGVERGLLGGALERAGAAVHDVPARWWAREPGARWRGIEARGSARALAALRRVRPDVVLSGSLVAPAGAVAARALGLPHVWWVQEFATRDHGYGLPFGERGTLRLVGALSRRVVVLGEALRAFVVAGGIPAARVAVIAPAPAAGSGPAPASARRGSAHAGLRLVLIGRVRPSKGHWDAVAALARLAADGLHARLDVVGDGELDALRAHARALGVGEGVVLHGGGHEVAPFLDAADVALVPSHCEAFGRVSLEAQSRGLPVVGAASGGTAELLAGGRGLTHAPGDVAGLAAAVARLAGDPALRARVARAGRAHAARFTPARFSRAWLTLLDAAAEPGAR